MKNYVFKLSDNDVSYQWFIDEEFESGNAQQSLSWLSGLSLEEHGYDPPKCPELKNF